MASSLSTKMEERTRLTGLWLVLARAAWVMLVSTILVAYAMVTWSNITSPITICDAPSCTMSVATAAAWRAVGLTPEFGNVLSSSVFNIVMALGFLAIAALIVWRRSDDWMAMLVSFSLIGWGLYLFSGVNLVLSSRPGWNLISQVLLASASLAFTALFYLFPNGRPVPRASRYLLGIFGVVWLVGTILNTNDILRGSYQGGANSSPVDVVEILLTLILLVGGIPAQVWRYARVSNATQRQQTKWVVMGFVGPILTLLMWFIYFSEFQTISGPAPAWLLLLSPLMPLFALAFPASVGIAVLRYRLWDIDLIIRRTLIYSTLTAILALFYFGSVVVLQQLLRGLTGQGSDLAIIISTLAIAALFVPVRNRVQRVIDHRFYRRKYDAALVLATFGATVRDEVDLGRLTDELQTVVEDTMQPEHVSLWLKRTEDGRRPAELGPRTEKA